MSQTVKFFSNKSGFTLVELLVAAAVAGILGTGIMSLYINNSRTYETQNLVTEAQQNIRAGMNALTRDIQMAGFDPDKIASAGFLQAGTDSLQVTMDLDRNGTIASGDENVTYAINGSGDLDRNGDTVAENVTALGFAYSIDADNDGELDADDNGTPGDLTDDRLIWAVIGANGNWWDLDTDGDGNIALADDSDGDDLINGVDTGVAADLDDIRAVKIWLLVETSRPDRTAGPPSDFVVGDQAVHSNDGLRRRLLVTSVNCRNMGM